MNVSTLLNCAVAAPLTGDEDEARRLETKADEIGQEGYRLFIDPPRIRLALARQELGDLAQLASSEPEWWEPPSAFLDALAALGDRERIEQRLRSGCRREHSANHSHSGRSVSPVAIEHCLGRRWSDSRQWSSPGTPSRPGACCKALLP